MKFLLDENLPHKLRFELGGNHEIFTVNFMRWQGKENGELLGLLLFNGFDGLITADKNLIYQQNLAKFPIKIVVLDALDNKTETLIPYFEKLQQMLLEEIEEQIIVVELP